MLNASASNYLDCSRLAACAIAPEPAWLWSEDGSRALWSNAAAASLFNAASVQELTGRRFGPSDAERQQVIRLAETLANDGAPRLERLRVFGAGLLMQPLVCACSRLPIDDETTAILISGIEPLRPALSLDDRVQRLIEGDNAVLASFNIAGDLVFASEPAQQLLSAANNIAAIEASALATEAISQGRSAGTIPLGPVVIWRVGREADTLLIVRFDAPRAQSSAEAADQVRSGPTNYGYAENISHAVALAKSGAVLARRHPLRFVWQLDPEQHFTVKSDEFLALVGPSTAQKNGALWGEICASLNIDPYQQVANAIATRDTWSGIILSWPTATGDHLRVELSGLPIFDRQRQFGGYRGFGVCRDTPQLARLMAMESGKPPPFASDLDPATESAPAPPAALPPTLSIVPSSANVVPFPAAAPAEQRSPGLSDGDRRAFSDIAQQLAARLRASARAENVAARGGEPAALVASPSHPARIDGRATTDTAGATNDDDDAWLADGSEGRALLDLLPFGTLIYRASEMLHANRAFLQRLGYATLEDFSEGGGLDMLQLGAVPEQTAEPGVQTLSIETGKAGPIEARLISMPHGSGSLSLLVLMEQESQHPLTALARATIRENGPDRALDKIHEHQLDGLRQRLDQTATGHTEFLKRINRDLRTPLTAIMGFAETILGERFGPIGNERYRDYLSGIRSAGSRILALVDELERDPQASDEQDKTGTPPTRSDIDLNRIVQACVAELQPEASRDRVLIRTSLHRPLPEIAADASAVRQIVLNLLTNSIRLAGAGGQVIISTGVSGSGAVSLRLRDTGTGLNETDVEALQGKATAGAHPDASEGRLKLAVAKALVEANRASLKISSRPEEGTLVEVSFHEMSPPAA